MDRDTEPKEIVPPGPLKALAATFRHQAETASTREEAEYREGVARAAEVKAVAEELGKRRGQSGS